MFETKDPYSRVPQFHKGSLTALLPLHVSGAVDGGEVPLRLLVRPPGPPHLLQVAAAAHGAELLVQLEVVHQIDLEVESEGELVATSLVGILLPFIRHVSYV